METWICGSLFVSPVQPYSRANAIVLAQMSICPAIWTERHVHEQSACEAGFGARSARLRMARLNGTCPHLKSGEPRWRSPSGTSRYPHKCLNGVSPLGTNPYPASCPNGVSPLGTPPLFLFKESHMNIGIFDSGIGGMSVLHQALATLPHENYIFYADTDHVPYGTKTKDQVISYVDEMIQFMLSHNCKAVVIACNTATSAAASIMRQKYTIPIIGIEPAVKPAVEQSHGRRVMVVATPLTIREEKLKNLVDRVDNAHHVDLLPLPELVTFAEREEFNSPQVEAYLHKELSSYDLSTYGELVLGCTHFNYFKDSFRKIMPSQVQIIDGNRGTVNQLKRILESTDRLEQSEGKVRYFTSGREVVASEQLARMDRLHARLEEMSRIK